MYYTGHKLSLQPVTSVSYRMHFAQVEKFVLYPGVPNTLNVGATKPETSPPIVNTSVSC